MEYTLTEAAEAVGKDRTTLFRAIKKGRLTARQEAGTYIIDAAELHRVYPLQVAQSPATDGARHALQDRATGAQGAVEAELRERIALLERTVDDQRRRLDAAEVALAAAQAATREAIAALPKQLPPPEAPVTARPRRWRLWGR